MALHIQRKYVSWPILGNLGSANLGTSNVNDFTISEALNLIKNNFIKIKNITIPNNLKYVKLHPLRTIPIFCN